MFVKQGGIYVHQHLIPPRFEDKNFRERGQQVAVQAIGKVFDWRCNR